MTDEKKISDRYRELGAEEPPRALDEAILAASRRRPARRWLGPVAAAAVLTLVVALTVQVERNKPDEMQASAMKVPEAARLPAPSAAPAPAPAPAREVPRTRAEAAPPPAAEMKQEALAK